MKKLLCCCLILVLCLAFSSVNASNTFYDTRGTKYEGVVERMARLGIINGMTETTFAPNRNVTRAELAKIVTKMNGMDEYAESSVDYKKIFSDVKEDDWFHPYVTVAADLELVNGYEDGTFKPNQEVTYAEMIVILLRNLGYNNIKEDSSNGWYWNYIKKMRELELNDNVGEFNYEKPAKRGDVAMFAWNALITDKWAISSENSKEGFTYSYALKTPLESYFEEYSFLDEETIDYIGGADNEIAIGAGYHLFYTREKTPLYALGGKITSLYNKETGELIGVTLDEDYEDVKIVSGPVFYLDDEGYNLSSANKAFYYGSKNDESYVYLVIENESNRIRRAVYLDSSNSIVVDSISTKAEKESGDDEITITINDKEYSSNNTVLYKNGFKSEWDEIKAGDIITNLGNGLFVYSNQKITSTIDNLDSKNDFIIINDEKYKIIDNCMCYIYNEEEAVEYRRLSEKKLKQQIGIEATLTLNIAEEVCAIEFGQTEEDKEKYKTGFVTNIRFGIDDNSENIKVNYGNESSNYVELKNIGNDWVSVGDLVMIGEKDGVDTHQIINKDTSFDNNISVKYEYDAKEIKYPMVGEYIVNGKTDYYKVTLKYKNNSIDVIENCQIEKLEFDDITDLSAYKITFVYNENMEIIKLFAVNEVNKFENQIALVKDKKVIKDNEDDQNNETCKLTLSVVNSVVRGCSIENNYSNIVSGDIITFNFEENSDTAIVLDELFKKESIGYKRDLIVNGFDSETKEITFTNGDKMSLDEDIYKWNSSKINLNKYRFIIADVAKRDGDWRFISLKMFDKEDVKVEMNDRLAIGELQDVIVIYRGYEE